MVWICEIITKMSEYFRLSKYFRKSLVMLPKHLTLIIERRLETTIYKDTMETPWLRNQCATAKQRGSVCHNPDHASCSSSLNTVSRKLVEISFVILYTVVIFYGYCPVMMKYHLQTFLFLVLALIVSR